jgi:hypothetical protein
MARVIALMALAALGLSGYPVHEPVHGLRPKPDPCGLLADVTARAIRLLACRLQEVRPRAACALAASIAQVIALTALAALRLFGAPFHESFHARQAAFHDRNNA